MCNYTLLQDRTGVKFSLSFWMVQICGAGAGVPDDALDGPMSAICPNYLQWVISLVFVNIATSLGGF